VLYAFQALTSCDVGAVDGKTQGVKKLGR